MNTFLFALKKELYKLTHKKKYIVFILIGAAVSLIRWGGSALITRLTDGYVTMKTNMTLEMLPFAVEILIPIIMFIAAADLFTHEYSADTLKMCLLQPITRFKLLTAKAAAVVITGAASLLIMYIVNMIIQLLSGGSIAQAPVTLAAYIIDILPLIGVAFLGILINVCLKGSASSMLLCLAVYAVMKYMGLYVAGSESFLFTASAKLHVMILGQALPMHILMYKMGILFGSILILYPVSYIIFDKKNV